MEEQGHRNPRILAVRGKEDLIRELEKVGVSREGIEIMVPKGIHYAIKLERVPLRAAILLKEEMLARGGDAAVSRDVASLSVEYSDVILLGTSRQYSELIRGLENPAQPFGLPAIAREIKSTIESWEITEPEVLHLGKFPLKLGKKTYVMGILNVTPDSFSDGGKFMDPDAALKRAQQMVAEGADIIDIGGESTRPGAEPVSEEEELRRVLPVVERLAAEIDVPISVDTYKARVADEALEAGAHMINDISALRMDPKLGEVVARHGVPIVLMHMQGTPRTMQASPHYEDCVSEVMAFLREAISRAKSYGIPESSIVIDPGIGFGKALEHNLEILRRLPEFRSLGRPVLIGPSRKSFIGKVLDLPLEERLEGTAATVAYAAACGVDFVRVHDVRAMARVVRMVHAIAGKGDGDER